MQVHTPISASLSISFSLIKGARWRLMRLYDAMQGNFSIALYFYMMISYPSIAKKEG